VFESHVVHTPQRAPRLHSELLKLGVNASAFDPIWRRSPQLPDDQTRPASGRAARSSPYGFASCSPISRCSKLIALSGRTITLKCVIRLPSALKVMMSTPLILTPSISFSNYNTAVVAAPFADIPEAGAARHLSRARQVLERDLTPALRRVYDVALEHGVGMQQGV